MKRRCDRICGLLIGMLFLLPAAAAQEKGEIQIPKGPFQPTWESLEKYQVPQWYLDAKFGIFIHWGVYSVPAFGNEWYPRRMYDARSKEFKHHLETFGPQSKFGYKDFIPQFRAEKFDAGHWAELFKKAGARYVVPVAEHHDGFAMYDSSLTEWCAARMGPKRDIIGELAAAVRKQGMVFGVSSHRIEHWWFFGEGMKFDSDVKDPKFAGLYGPARDQKESEPGKDGTPPKTPPDKEFMDDWLARTTELVDKYQPQLFWFDWWIEQPVMEPYRRMFAAYYYNRGAQWRKGVALNYKKKSFPDKAAVLDIERGQLAEIRPFFWQTDTSVSKNSWGYVSNQNYKTAGSIIGDLVDIVSKNGVLLLNIGPRPDGTIPEPEEKMLLEIGQWLAVNGEAVYGTRPWQVFGEGPTKIPSGGFTDTKRGAFTPEDIRFTVKGDSLYALVLAWPEAEAKIKSLGTRSSLCQGKIREVQLLGHAGKLSWRQEEEGLVIRMPETKPGEHAFAFRIRGLKVVPFQAR